MKIKKIGDRFGRLILLEFLNLDHAGKRLVKTICDCGTERITRLNNLGRKTNSCGCLKAELIKERMGKPIEHLACVSMLNACRRYTKNTDLTQDDIKKLIFSNCFYCEGSPEEVGTTYRRAIDDGRKIQRVGIDRIDSLKGYMKNNVVSCCITCNHIKRNYKIEDLLKRLEIFTKNLKTLVEERKN